MREKPYIINFPKIGDSILGYISLVEKQNLMFIPKRIYWTYLTPEDVVRGYHAHYELEQILVAVSGKIEVNLELTNGEKFEFILDTPDKGLYIPTMAWHTMKYSYNAVQMCIASMEYDENDYIRNYQYFKIYKNDETRN